MRKSVTSGETGREVSACEGMDYEDVRRMTKRLGCEAGFQPPPTLYAFRRGGGKTLDGEFVVCRSNMQD